ncbi:MAG: HAMP domain-containing histidine kinase [Armatimonadetes bacterium]|nr:HAMP domain-containing histidine kinase [Armatimonadota bacterium]
MLTTWTGETEFASAERSDAAALAAQRAVLAATPLFGPLLEAIPGMAFVLNRHRQIVGANHRALVSLGLEAVDPIVGQRPGELFGCVVAEGAPSGCGTARECAFCGAAQAILESLETQAPAQRECRLRTSGDLGGGAFELDVQSSFVATHGSQFLVVGLRDLSDEKRRRLLERTFFHDVLNTAGGVLGVSEILSEIEGPPEEDELKSDLTQLADQLVEEIIGQRQLLAAEAGELSVSVSETDLTTLLHQAESACRRHDVAQGRDLHVVEPEPVSVATDPALLRRVLVNLVKNALEATPVGGRVTLGAGIAAGDRVALWVNNPGVMPDAVRAQLFQRSFSTKGGTGRGIGTFSVKLFCERYLGGRVAFESNAADGTTFTVTVPRTLARAPK